MPLNPPPRAPSPTQAFESLKDMEDGAEAAEIFHEALMLAKEQLDTEEELKEKRLEIEAEMVRQQQRVDANVTMKDEDETAMVSALKKDVQKVWGQVEAGRKQELELRRNIAAIRRETINLQRTVETGEGIELEEEETVRELVGAKDRLVSEQAHVMDTIEKLRQEELEVQGKIVRLENDRLEIVNEKASIEVRRKEKLQEARREEERRVKYERELGDLRAQLDEQQEQLRLQQEANAQWEEEAKAIERRVKEVTTAVEKQRRELAEKVAENTKVNDELQEQTRRNTHFNTDNAKREVAIRALHEETDKVKEEIAKVQKVRETTLHMTTRVHRKIADLEREKEALQVEIQGLERDLEVVLREVEQVGKRIGGYVRERDVLNKIRTAKDAATVKVADLVKVIENNKLNLEHEISGFAVEQQRQEKAMRDLEKERERLNQEAEAASAKHLTAMEDVRLRELAILELQQRITDVEQRLKQQQNLYEAVRSDRNLYSKNLLEAQDEISEMKRRFKMMSHTISQLKDVIKQKNMEMVVYQLKKENIEKTKALISEKLSLIVTQITEADEVVGNQKEEIEKLNRIINEADSELDRQQKEYDIVVNERDILGQQLIKRNHELARVYERIKVQQSMLGASQATYRTTVRNVTDLKRRVVSLKAELEALQTSVSDIGGLRNETHRVRRQLLREQAKVKALQEELTVPMNVHRWRKLEGSDPEAFERIQHVQSLQRRLIAKTEEVLERDLMIQESEKLYIELKNVLARQPGPEAAEQLSLYEKTLKQKKHQLKGLERDLKSNQARVLEHKYEIERLVGGLRELKDKWFAEKRSEMRASVHAQQVVEGDDGGEMVYGGSLGDEDAGGGQAPGSPDAPYAGISVTDWNAGHNIATLTSPAAGDAVDGEGEGEPGPEPSFAAEGMGEGGEPPAE